MMKAAYSVIFWETAYSRRREWQCLANRCTCRPIGAVRSMPLAVESHVQIIPLTSWTNWVVHFYRSMRSLEQIVAVLPWCSSVCLNPRGTGMHCDHTVHVRADLSLMLASPMCVLVILTPKHVYLLPAVFLQFQPKGTDMQTRRDI